MKKIILGTFVVLLLIGSLAGWKIIGPGTAFEGKQYYLHIATGSNYEAVLDTLTHNNVLNSPAIFKILAKQLEYPQKVKAGRYTIKNGMSLLNMLRILKNGQQEPINLVITKIRTKQDLAAMVGRKFECDSAAFMQFLNNKDSLEKYQLDSNTVFTSILPNTYTYYWNTTPSKIFAKFRNSYEEFWTADRRNNATAHKLNPQTAYILASIVEEETLKKEDKGKIASVYLNRLAKGMRLGADPTVKFALHNFGLKRIYEKHLSVESPYNTYKVYGLPPGPICTPSEETIDAVITAPVTDYMFFVAKADLSGYSNFASNYTEHMKYAKEYQQMLNRMMEEKKTADSLAHEKK